LTYIEKGKRERVKETTRTVTHKVDGTTGEEALVSGIELFLTGKVPAADVVGL
jgi:hypothetical protein